MPKFSKKKHKPVDEHVYIFQYPQNEKNTNQWWKHLLSGAISGLIAKTATAPMDRVKILSQVHGKSYGVVGGIRKMIKEGGLLSMWRGNGVNIMKFIPESAIKFLIYEEMKKQLKNQRKDTSSTSNDRLIAGGVAGGLANTLVYPIEVVKTRRAIQKTISTVSVVQIAKDGYKNHGIKFFVKGYPVTICGIICFTGLDLTVYEALKDNCFQSNKCSQSACVTLSAASACMAGQLVTYPLQLLGAAMQAEDRKKKRTVELLKARMKKGGISGLYRGLIPSLFKGVPSITIQYVIYEKCLDLFGARMS